MFFRCVVFGMARKFAIIEKEGGLDRTTLAKLRLATLHWLTTRVAGPVQYRPVDRKKFQFPGDSLDMDIVRPLFQVNNSSTHR